MADKGLLFFDASVQDLPMTDDLALLVAEYRG